MSALGYHSIRASAQLFNLKVVLAYVKGSKSTLPCQHTQQRMNDAGQRKCYIPPFPMLHTAHSAFSHGFVLHKWSWLCTRQVAAAGDTGEESNQIRLSLCQLYKLHNVHKVISKLMMLQQFKVRWHAFHPLLPVLAVCTSSLSQFVLNNPGCELCVRNTANTRECVCYVSQTSVTYAGDIYAAVLPQGVEVALLNK